MLGADGCVIAEVTAVVDVETVVDESAGFFTRLPREKLPDVDVVGGPVEVVEAIPVF